MLDCDYELAAPSEKKEFLLQEDTVHLATIESVKRFMDEVINHVMDLRGEPMTDNENYSNPFHEANAFAESLFSDALLGKIASAIGSVTADNNPNPLFTCTSDNLESHFLSEVSSIELNKVTGVTPEFLTQIW